MKSLKNLLFMICLMTPNAFYGMNFTDLIQKDHKKLAEELRNKKIELEFINKFINKPDEKNGKSPLMIALEKGFVELAELLIDNGAEINAQDKFGNTPLHLAAFNNNNHPEIIKLLLGHKANIHAKNLQGITPLHYAKDPKVINLLVQNGADINAKDNDFTGLTPLHLAVIQNHHLDAIKALVQNGADVNTKDEAEDETPLEWALRRYQSGGESSIEIIKYLTLYANMETLKAYPEDILKHLDKNMQNFITWLQNRAETQTLKTDDILTFTPLAFTIPACADEFKSLIALLKKDDYKTVFTNNVVRDALITRNTEAFKELFSLAGENKTIIDRIREELNKLDDQQFANTIRAIVSKVPMKMKPIDITYTFK